MMTRSRDKIVTAAQLGKQAHDRKLKLTRNTKMSENPKIFILETFLKSPYSNTGEGLADSRYVADAVSGKDPQKVLFPNCLICHSRIGMVGGRQQLSLGRGCNNHGIIIHEVGHALGLYHEQNRNDRDKYLKIIWDNILPSQRHNFKQQQTWATFLMTSFDYDSIMEYGSKSFSKNGLDTIEVLDKTKSIKEPYLKSGPTKKDTYIMNSLYGCQGYTRPTMAPMSAIICNFQQTVDDCHFRNESGASFDGKFHKVTKDAAPVLLDISNIECFHWDGSVLGLYFTTQSESPVNSIYGMKILLDSFCTLYDLELLLQVYAEHTVIYMISGKVISRALRAHFLAESDLVTIVVEEVVCESDHFSFDVQDRNAIAEKLNSKESVDFHKAFEDKTEALSSKF
ncbi:Zinc metalloproteinase nas-13 [Nymphon striatum]|nr:Zinc metalloproteinase nas-13 [Nymphon striatum]